MYTVKNYAQFITEMKSEREIVRDIARRLSHDKDIIKYLNTSRAKRKVGWRELLGDKLHGGNLDYINYITKNMVADYNPQITGYINIGKGEESGEGEGEEFNFDGGVTRINLAFKELQDRLDNIEDVLQIDPEEEETVEITKNKMSVILGEDSDIDEEE